MTPDWIPGWVAAIEWLEGYGGPEGGLLAAEMRTRLPEPEPIPEGAMYHAAGVWYDEQLMPLVDGVAEVKPQVYRPGEEVEEEGSLYDPHTYVDEGGHGIRWIATSREWTHLDSTEGRHCPATPSATYTGTLETAYQYRHCYAVNNHLKCQTEAHWVDPAYLERTGYTGYTDHIPEFDGTEHDQDPVLFSLLIRSDPHGD